VFTGSLNTDEKSARVKIFVKISGRALEKGRQKMT
jgi:hypothetical protein